MSDNDPVWMVYITVADRAEAESLADVLVRRRVAACVNILGAIQSVYEWQGNVEKSSEIAMIAKTTRSQFPALEKAVKEMHTYTCPCIVAWPVSAGYMPFLTWVNDQVGPIG